MSSDFTKGNIMKSLLGFMAPVLGALFLQAMYGAVDLLVVGKFGTPVDVSAVGTGSQIMTTLTNLLVSFSMGTTIFLGQTLGEGKPHKGGDIIGNSILPCAKHITPRQTCQNTVRPGTTRNIFAVWDYIEIFCNVPVNQHIQNTTFAHFCGRQQFPRAVGGQIVWLEKECINTAFFTGVINRPTQIQRPKRQYQQHQTRQKHNQFFHQFNLYVLNPAI